MLAECAIILKLFTITVPPPKFDCRYEGELIILYTPSKDVHSLCKGKVGAFARIWACSMPQGARCVIVLPKIEAGIVSQAQQDRLRRHEEGHCRGWGADHKGEVFTFRPR